MCCFIQYIVLYASFCAPYIIWIIGVVLCVKAVLEIMKWPVDGVKKLLVAIIILLTSWIGICVYYFWGRENLPQILK